MKQQLKNIAKQAAKQIVQEPLEILKQVGEQVAGTPSGEDRTQQRPAEKPVTQEEVQKKQAKSRSLYKALQSELNDIEVRKAREAQVEQQVQNPPLQEKQLVEPATKRSRKLFNIGQKAQAQKQQTHVEKPVQSST